MLIHLEKITRERIIFPLKEAVGELAKEQQQNLGLKALFAPPDLTIEYHAVQAQLIDGVNF